MGALRTWSGWKRSSHKPVLLCVGVSRRLPLSSFGFPPSPMVCSMSVTVDDTSEPTKRGDYLVVARRYRPQTFDELIGQEHVARALKQAITAGRVGHAYLFTGSRGVGKTSAARIMAKALNCQRGPTPTPCNECDVCRSVTGGDDVDVIEIDGASNRGIDDIRQLRQNASIRPSRATFKIYIIDEVHMLSKDAFNALLKTLEEPPEHVKFIFATTEPEKVPITILSRCQRFDFAGIDAMSIENRLAQIAVNEGVEIDAESLAILAGRAAGSMRDSQSLLEQLLAGCDGKIVSDDVNHLLGIAPATRLASLVEALVDRNANVAFSELDSAMDDGADAGQIIDQLIGYFRDIMAARVGCDERQFRFALRTQFAAVKSLAERLGVETVLAIVAILDETAARLRVSVHARTLAEMAAVRICHLHDLDNLSEIAAGIDTSNSAPLPTTARPTAPQRPTVSQPNVRRIAQQADTKNSEPNAHRATRASLDAATLPKLWQQSLTTIEGLIADNAALAERVVLASDGAIEVVFSPEHGFSKDICERPENKQQIEQALATSAGGSVTVRFGIDKSLATAATNQPAAKPMSRRELTSEVVERDLVKQVMELFDVDLSRLKVIPPRVEQN